MGLRQPRCRLAPPLSSTPPLHGFLSPRPSADAAPLHATAMPLQRGRHCGVAPASAKWAGGPAVLRTEGRLGSAGKTRKGGQEVSNPVAKSALCGGPTQRDQPDLRSSHALLH